MMDKKSRKIVIFLINEELKRYKSYPRAWTEGAVKDLEGIKKGLELCEAIRSRKRVDNGESESSSPGQSAQST